VSFNQTSMRIQVKFASTNTPARSLKVLVPSLIEFEINGSRSDKVSDVKKLA